jgi:replication-associated recombination protein RarA
VTTTRRKSCIVHGPQGCGKTRNARALAKALKLKFIFDNWVPGTPAPRLNHLILTHYEHREDTDGRTVLRFEDAMKLVRPPK